MPDTLMQRNPEHGAIAMAEAAVDDELAAMQEMFGADFAELAGLYLTDCPKRIVALHTAALEKNAVHAARAAHTLSGSCASIGASGLAALCQALEIDCRAGNLAFIGMKLHVIELEYARIAAKLQSMLAQ